jgi:hypothetical protein
MTMDTISTTKPPLVHDGLPTALPAVGISPAHAPLTPLDLSDAPTVRTKLRLYAILLALYVTWHAFLQSIPPD